MNNLLKGLNIYLIGMMGSGKSTIGHLLASALDYRFFDTDTLIEKVTETSINDLFKNEGEAYFRDLETSVLAQVSTYTRSVIATGGGMVIKPKNWSYLRYGLTIWLDTPVEVLTQRLAQDDTRPLLKETDLNLKLTTLLEARITYYQQADLTIKIEVQQTPEMITEHILQKIPSVLKCHDFN
jgi:shikimate kinase